MYYSVNDVLDFVRDNDVKFVKLGFCDLFGVQKNISIMVDELEHAFEHGIAFNPTGVQGFGYYVETDLLLKPVASTMLVLPWRPQQGRVVQLYCEIMHLDGTPYELDGRRLLKDALKACNEKQLKAKMGVKCEFYLFKTDENGDSTGEPIDQGEFLDISPKDRGENVRRDICLTLEQMGIGIERSFHERGPGQNEIDLRDLDAMATADNYITFKNVVRSIAARSGVHASFLPKPLPGKSGNGLHINFSLYAKGENLFASDKEMMDHFLAGIVNRMQEMTLVLNTQPVSYDRFGESEAPKYITWSTENRHQLLKVPHADEKGGRVVLRSPDAFINPYIGFAALLRAGLAGIDNKEELPAAVDQTINLMDPDSRKALETLPESLQEAISYARAGKFLKESFGEDFVEHFITAIESGVYQA